MGIAFIAAKFGICGTGGTGIASAHAISVSISIGLGALLLPTATTAADPPAPPPRPRPVTFGGNDDLDACMSLGVVKAKNFVYLKGAPSKAAGSLAKLPGGQPVHVCDEDESGHWLGVVVPGGKDSEDCRTTSPMAHRAPYKGPCASGWLEARQVEIVAG